MRAGISIITTTTTVSSLAIMAELASLEPESTVTETPVSLDLSEGEEKCPGVETPGESDGSCHCVAFQHVSYQVTAWKVSRTDGSRLPRPHRERKTIINGVRYEWAGPS